VLATTKTDAISRKITCLPATTLDLRFNAKQEINSLSVRGQKGFKSGLPRPLPIVFAFLGAQFHPSVLDVKIPKIKI